MSRFNYFAGVWFLLWGFQIISPVFAEESTIKEKILFYDDKYSVRYAGDVEPALSYFTAHGFKLMNTPELLKWIDNKTKTATCGNTVVLQLSDITSKELVEPWDKTAPLYRYCENGGRWVAPGGNPLYAFEGANDINIYNQDTYHKDDEKFMTKCFGIHRVYGLRGKGRVLTAEGKTWGIAEESDKWMKFLTTGEPANDVAPLVISEEGNAALVWYKNVNSKYPYSGLVGACVNLSDSEPLLRLIHRLCIFDGKPGNIQAKDWKPKKTVPDFAVNFNASQGGIPRKAYQRGEIIPLAVNVYGSKYNGQKIEIQLHKDADIAWEKTYPSSKLTSFSATENVDTSPFSCGEYILSGIIDGQKINQEKIWICPERRNNSFPLFVCKMHRKNPAKEDLALKYVRENNVNVLLYDIYQMVGAETNPKTAKVLGNYLDLLLRNNITAGARPCSMELYTDKQEEKLVLYDGSVHKHGVNHEALSSHGFITNYLDKYRDGLRKQVSLLRNSKSPSIIPYFITNDDGSMLGNYDFNPLTIADFQKKTKLTEKNLPPLEKMKEGNNVFMPVVPAGIVDDNHPWLQYFRLHCENYNKIATAAMEGIESAWPGSFVADIGCMSGPLYIPRGFYPPLSFKAYNTASFYQYLFWSHQYSFAIEAARMGNKEKPVGLTTSASWIAWGKVFQEAVLYRILAEAPLFVGLWALDARRDKFKESEDDCWKGTKSVADKVAQVSEFLKLQKITPRKGALFFGLAQNCFRTKDIHRYPYYMSTALEHFQRAGAKLDLLCGEEVQQGMLAEYDIIFINDHQWITKGEKKFLEDYIEKGGVVVADANTTFEVKGAIKADGPFGAGLDDLGKADRIERCRKYVDSYLKPPMVKAVSENTIVRVNQVSRVPIAWVLDVESEKDIAALKKAQNDDWDSGVYNYLKEKVKKNPTADKKIMVKSGYYAYDLWDHKELALEKSTDINWNTANLTVDSFCAVPIVLYKDKIHKLIAKDSSKTLSRGDAFIASFELLSDKNTPVRELVPALVTVYSADGKEAWEYGGNTIIDNGLLTVHFNTANNDITGKWKIVVKELSSGKTAETEFSLK